MFKINLNKYPNKIISFLKKKFSKCDSKIIQDALSETYIKCSQPCPKHKEKSESDFFCKRILKCAERKIIDEVRKRKRIISLDGQLANDSGFDISDSGRDENKIYDMLEIEEIKSKFKPQELKLFNLFFIENYKQSEIAEMLGLKLSTVKMRIKNLKNKMKI